MSEAFVAFVRPEDRVLLMQRSDDIGDLPGAWDGVYGAGDPDDIEAVTARISECTGIDSDALTYVRSGAARGISFGKTSSAPARLVEVTPLLFLGDKANISAKTIYKNCEWIDPGRIGEKEYSMPRLSELYGDVASFLYILKTSIGQEQNVAKEIRARLSGTGSLEDIQDEIFSVLQPQHMKGYVFVEASAKHHVEKVIGRTGMSTTPMKNCRKVLDGESPLEDVRPYLEPKAATAGIEEGCIVEITGGAFRGQSARVVRVTESKEEVTVELYEALVPVALTVRADQVRVTQRVE